MALQVLGRNRDGQGSGSGRKASKGFLGMGFRIGRRIGLYERISAFLDADIDIVRALTAIRDRYDSKKSVFGRDTRAKILSAWIDSMSDGASFSDAIAPYVPTSEHMLINAGEEGGNLIAGLKEATVLSTAAQRNKSTIIGGLAFPIMLLAMIGGLLIMFQVKMVPIFENLLPLERWTASGRSLYALSYFFYHYLWILLACFGGLAFLISSTMGSWTRPPRQFFDRLPPWSIYRTYQGSSFLIGLSSLMRAGVATFDALMKMHGSASPWTKVHLEKMMSAMKSGSLNPGKALDTGLLTDEEAGDVEDYSTLGNFEDAILKIGSRSLEKSIKDIQQKMDILRNLLLFVVAFSIGWVYMTSYGLQTEIANSITAAQK